MAALAPDSLARSVLEPVLAVLDAALPLLPAGRSLSVSVEEVPGLFLLDGDRLLLSTGFLGPGIVHPDEPPSPLPPLDRWRRAAGCVLEAWALRVLAEMAGKSVGSDWRWIGAAVHAADMVAPELGLGVNELGQALHTGDPGTFPRAGVAACRAWVGLGRDPIAQIRYLLDDGVLSPSEWLSLGAWMFSHVPALLPTPVARAPDADIPLELAAWRWVPLKVPAHPRGGRIRVEGDGAIGDAWAVAGRDHRALVGSAAGGCRLLAEPGGPVGEWVVASAEAFGQVMGARGVFFRFAASGALQVVLADAFVGPLAAVSVAGEVGTSGVADGRWGVAGQYLLSFQDIVPVGITMHSRGRRDRFMMPAAGFGLAEWLAAMCTAPWGWILEEDRLILRGTMLGGPVQVRFRREVAAP